MERHLAGVKAGKSPAQIRAELDAELVHAVQYELHPQTVRVPDWRWADVWPEIAHVAHLHVMGLLICPKEGNVYFFKIPESTTAICSRCLSTYDAG